MDCPRCTDLGPVRHLVLPSTRTTSSTMLIVCLWSPRSAMSNSLRTPQQIAFAEGNGSVDIALIFRETSSLGYQIGRLQVKSSARSRSHLISALDTHHPLTLKCTPSEVTSRAIR